MTARWGSDARPEATAVAQPPKRDLRAIAR